MTDTQLDIMEIKETLKRMQEDIDVIKYGKYVNSPDMQNAMFNTWLNQYDNKSIPGWVNVCEVPQTQGCNIYKEDGTLKDEYLPRN